MSLGSPPFPQSYRLRVYRIPQQTQETLVVEGKNIDSWLLIIKIPVWGIIASMCRP